MDGMRYMFHELQSRQGIRKLSPLMNDNPNTWEMTMDRLGYRCLLVCFNKKRGAGSPHFRTRISLAVHVSAEAS